MIPTPKLNSPSNAHFSEVPQVHVGRSTFLRPSEVHTANSTDFIYPFYVEEVLPGDTHIVKADVLSRIMTPIKPFMSNLYFDMFFFFIPNRLVWDNWEKFNGAQTDPDDSTDYTLPLMYLPAAGWSFESLQDYLNYGSPLVLGNDTSTYSVHNLVGRGYNLVYNEFFRDQNLINSAVVDKDDGPDTVTDYILRKRGKRHDYFTSALPWPQKGDSLGLFVSGQAPVYGAALGQGSPLNAGYFLDNAQLWQASNSYGASSIYSGPLGSNAASPSPIQAPYLAATGGVNPQFWNNGTTLYGLSMATQAQYTAANAALASGLNFSPPYADLSSATSNTINEFRTAFQLQMLLENDARGGTRYVEILRAHFGVVSPDFRLQRPEYLGGGSIKMNMQSVPQTAVTGTTPQGNLAAFGLFDGKNGFSKSFVEHGYVIGLFNIRTDLSYQQGVEKHYLRRTRFDYYWPAFAHLGEQVIQNQEIYQLGLAGGTSDSEVWAYQERAAEYRYKNSIITGKMRSTYPQSLDVWHLAQEFNAVPELGKTFIEEAVPISRVVAVTNEPAFQTDIYLNIRSTRPMPVYSVPGLITRL